MNNNESPSPEEPRVEVSPTTFEITSQQGNDVTITMTQNCGSACWDDFRDSVSLEGRVYSITTTARVTGEVCTEQCVRYSRDYEIILPGTGEYTFRYVVADTTAAELSFLLN